MTTGEAVDLFMRGVDALEAIDPEIEDWMESVVEVLMNRYPMLMDFQPGPAGRRPPRCSGRPQ